MALRIFVTHSQPNCVLVNALSGYTATAHILIMIIKNCYWRIAMNVVSKTLIALAVATALSGCVTTQTQTPVLEKSNLTSGQVSLTLKKNKTTQTEVVETFGAPNLVTQNASGEEVWTYQRHATVANASASEGYATIIFAGIGSRSSGFEQSSRTITLIIKFKEIGGVKLVSDFSSRSTSF
jgi:outer membrane protein assembly factor BamE (lipoprotein component of BamABCDE complex)